MIRKHRLSDQQRLSGLLRGGDLHDRDAVARDAEWWFENNGAKVRSVNAAQWEALRRAGGSAAEYDDFSECIEKFFAQATARFGGTQGGLGGETGKSLLAAIEGAAARAERLVFEDSATAGNIVAAMSAVGMGKRDIAGLVRLAAAREFVDMTLLLVRNGRQGVQTQGERPE